MDDEIPKELVDLMMVKCGRRCCICRRFRPTKLQLHHIQERNRGGSNEEDNLIVVCFSCHSDVHTRVPFARRFSLEELKGHRDALVRMVEQGVLDSADTDDTDEAMAEVTRALRATGTVEKPIMAEAIELLLAAAIAKENRQGLILASMTSGGLRLYAGGGPNLIPPSDRRAEAKYKHGLEVLVNCGLVERESDSCFWVSHQGYLIADELLVSRGQANACSE